ncbi:uncharacterized protein [Diadema setosum]|uniref:uncharacterized protein n=1 Tax=Diadema setosum TaxID=31175 RepID=UPI003B3B91DB
MVTMTAKAVFKCHPSSHHFDERHIRLSEPVKIGRSVAKARPALDNGIFDCKVLSRNHALIWYDSDSSKFYLQDTKSSNGTFVNSNRLSRGSEESPAQEICSGDIVQFGVDVMENSRRGVVTHGCIVAELSLFHQDGTEATRSDSSLSVGSGFNAQSVTGNNNVPSQELYQLSHYLKEALHREQMLEQKLVALQRLVSSTQEATESSWQALIDEDRLLSRLEVVENQLRAYSKANTEESIRKELIALQEDKSTYEKTVKESLKKALEEKLEACRKVADTEQMLSNSEDECAHAREELENLRQEQDLLLEKYSQLEKDSQELLVKMGDADKQHQEELERLRGEQRELEERISTLQKAESSLGARAEELQAENDIIKKQLASTKERLEETQEALKLAGSAAGHVTSQDADQVNDSGEIVPASNVGSEDQSGKERIAGAVDDDMTSHHAALITNGDDRTPTRESGVQVESLWREAVGKELNGRVRERSDGAKVQPVKSLKNSAEEMVFREVKKYKLELEDAQIRQVESDRLIGSLRSKVDDAHREMDQHRREIASLEQRLQEAEETTRAAVARAVSELQERLSGSGENSGRGGGDFGQEETDSINVQTLVDEPLVVSQQEERQQQSVVMSQEFSSTLKPSSFSGSSLSSSSPPRLGAKRDSDLHNHVHGTNSSHSEDLDATLLEIDTLKDELHTLRSKYSQLTSEKESISKELSSARNEARIAHDKAVSLQGQLDAAELSSRETKALLPPLKEQLKQESELVKKQSLDIESLQRKLVETSGTASNTQNELETCKVRIRALSDDLERERQSRQKLEKEVALASSLQQELAGERREKERLQAETRELQLKVTQLEKQQESRNVLDEKKTSEDKDLKSKMAALETDLKSSQQERSQMSREVERLELLLKEAEFERGRLADSRRGTDRQVDDLRTERDDLQKRLTKAEEALERLRAGPQDDRSEVDGLRQRLENVTMELTKAKSNNAMAQMRWLPVSVIIIAIIAAVSQSILAMWMEV